MKWLSVLDPRPLAPLFSQLRQSCANPNRRSKIGNSSVLVCFQQAFQHIARLQKGIYHTGGDRNFIFTNTIKQGFQNMRHFGHVGETECAASSFNGMSCAEDRIQLIRIRRIRVKRKQ